MVPRFQLINRLNEALRFRRKLTLVSAPAGFGKTTLVREWLDRLTGERDSVEAKKLSPAAPLPRSPASFAWLSLDEEDNDPTRFLSYLIAALQQIDPIIGQTWLKTLQFEGSGLAIISEQIGREVNGLEVLLTTVVNQLAALSSSPILVLDDYHMIETNFVHEIVTFLLDHLPPQMHIVLISRANPPLALARLRLRGELTEIKAADLRFTIEESAAFFKQSLRQPLTQKALTTLNNRTEGWAAALQAVALSLRNRENSIKFIESFSGAHRYIFTYLTEEVFQRQPALIQKFLGRTSILDRLCGPLCDAVLEDLGMAAWQITDATASPTSSLQLPLTNYNSQTILEYLEQANLFIIPLDDHGEWYRYHYLFANFLRGQLQRTDPTLIPDLHRRAAEWLQARDLPAEAVKHALAAEDFDLAARLIEQVGRTLWMNGELTTLTGWLKRLPEEVLSGHPSLNLLYAWTLFPGHQLAEVEAYVEAAEQAIGVWRASEIPSKASRQNPKSEIEEALRGEIALIRAIVARMRGEAQQTLMLSQQAIEKLSPDNLTLQSAAMLNLGHGYRQSGDTTAARRAFSEARTLSEAGDNLYIALLALSNLAGVQAAQGHLNEAEKSYRQALHLAAERGSQQLSVTSLAHAGLGQIYAERGDLKEAEHHLHLGLERAKQGRYIQVTLDGYQTLARVKQAQGQDAEAQSLLQQAAQLAKRAGSQLSVAGLQGTKKFKYDQSTLPPTQDPGRNPLSKRELEVLVHMAAGASNQEIAAEMVVTIHTVKKHVSHILQKLDVSSRTQAAARARELGLI